MNRWPPLGQLKMIHELRVIYNLLTFCQWIDIYAYHRVKISIDGFHIEKSGNQPTWRDK
jgi:hypothetical protein